MNLHTPGQILRLLHIQRVLIRNGLDEVVFSFNLFRKIRFVQYLLPWNWLSRKQAPRATKIRMALEELGPIYIKFGQLLSTRRDMLPEDIANELARLQDNVPPFSSEIAKSIIEKALGESLQDIFLQFDEEPLASASIAQVHSATMKDGRSVIVKVVRPGIEKIILRDLGLIHRIAVMAETYSSDMEKLKLSGVVHEFEKTLLNELDLMREAANASQLRRNFADSELLYVPQVEWEYARHNVILMERISGIPVKDIQTLRKAGIDLKWLSESLIEIFFMQVFRDSYFHADMHPGNIFVKPGEGDGTPKIMVVDFGIMSSLSEYDKRYLAENLFAFLNKNYQKVAELHVQSGWVPAKTRVDEFEFAIRTVCEPLFDRPIKDISFGVLLLRLFQTAERFNMVIMPQLFLLQKTLVNIEGLGRELYPDLNLWDTARPHLEKWMNDKSGIRSLFKGASKNLPYLVDKLPELPTNFLNFLELIRQGKFKFDWNQDELEKIRHEMKKNSRRTISAVMGGTLLLGCFILFGIDNLSSGASNLSLMAFFLGVLGIVSLYSSYNR